MLLQPLSALASELAGARVALLRCPILPRTRRLYHWLLTRQLWFC